MPFFRMYKNLLPRARAWRLAVGTQVRALFEGLTGAPKDARDFVDGVWSELDPDDTTELEKWERQFGLLGRGTDAQRRQALASAWAATGGQDPRYLQDTMQAAGFPVYIHEWWSSASPYVARDPRDYTTQPLIGTEQCDSDTSTQPQCDSDQSTQPQCNDFLASEPGYIVNLNLSPIAPPPVPGDSSDWPYFLYWGAETFPGTAFIDEARRREFERLLLRLNPTQQWLVTRVHYDEDPPPEVLQESSLFLRADFGINLDDTTGDVEQWDPISARFVGESATQLTDAEQPAFVASSAIFNGHPLVDADDTDDNMVLAHDLSLSISADGWYAVAVIASASTATGGEYVITKWDPGNEWAVGLDSGSPSIIVRNDTDTANISASWGPDIRDGDARIVEWFHTSTEIGVSVNGGTDVTASATFRQDTTDVQLFALGTINGPKLVVAAIAVLPFMPTADERQSIRDWLARYIP